MSKKQKKSRPARSGSSAAPAAEPRRAGLRDVSPRADLADAAQQEGSPAMLITALIGTTLFIGAYFHLLVLQQMTQLTGGLAMPDSMLIYGQDHVAALSAVMDDAARGQLNWVHKTAGVIFAVAVALTVAAVGAWRLKPAAAKWGALALGVLFAVVDIWEGLAIETAIAAGGPGTGLAATLTAIRWLLLAVITVAVVVMLWAGRRRRPRA
ncbi:hypothetical protein [Micrococcus porci]|uniref:hypothetical protein n=1 Tax=Micrococcus porci TaxID=2856555 RepID=UPI003CEB8F79